MNQLLRAMATTMAVMFVVVWWVLFAIGAIGIGWQR